MDHDSAVVVVVGLVVGVVLVLLVLLVLLVDPGTDVEVEVSGNVTLVVVDELVLGVGAGATKEGGAAATTERGRSDTWASAAETICQATTIIRTARIRSTTRKPWRMISALSMK